MPSRKRKKKKAPGVYFEQAPPQAYTDLASLAPLSGTSSDIAPAEPEQPEKKQPYPIAPPGNKGVSHTDVPPDILKAIIASLAVKDWAPADVARKRQEALCASVAVAVDDLFADMVQQLVMTPMASTYVYAIAGTPAEDFIALLYAVIASFGWEVDTDRESYITIYLPPQPLLVPALGDYLRVSAVQPL